MINYVGAAVFTVVAIYGVANTFAASSTLGSLFYLILAIVAGGLAYRRITKIIATDPEERAAFYDRGVTEGYQPKAGPQPPIPTTGSGVKPPMSQGWQVPQPSSALPHSTTPVAPHSVSSDNNPTLNMGIGALVGGVLGWQLGKSSETEAEETKEAPAPRAYRLGDAGDVGATGAIGDVGEPSYALPAITSEELDRSSSTSSYDSGSSYTSTYDSSSSSSDSGSSGGGE